jgi:epimerase EvaD
MRARNLAVTGAVEFTPQVFADDRGHFLSPFQGPEFVHNTRRELFRVSQVSYSVSRRGVVRGVHFTATPPGIAKYVYCPHGTVLDVVVDLRLGSPTFGRWDSVLLGDTSRHALYLPVGVGHAFVALEDDSMMTYVMSGSYVKEQELEVSVFDRRLALPIPDDIEPLLSQRDSVAPTLAEAEARGLLPRYDECVALDEALAPVHV